MTKNVVSLKDRMRTLARSVIVDGVSMYADDWFSRCVYAAICDKQADLAIGGVSFGDLTENEIPAIIGRVVEEAWDLWTMGSAEYLEALGDG